MADFTLRNVPLLSRVGADRADTLRTDVDAAIAGWKDALLLRVDRRNQVLISGGQVVLSPAAELGTSPTSTRCSWAGCPTAGTCGACAPLWRTRRA